MRQLRIRLVAFTATQPWISTFCTCTRAASCNFAWAFISEKHPSRKIKPLHVTLFHPKFREACPSLASIARDIDQHAAWARDVKNRRDPVAHRIPLYIPPSIDNSEEGKRYNELAQKQIDLASEQRFEEAQDAFDAIDRIGTFVPWFLHTRGNPIPLYPTVPSDLAHVIHIGNIIERVL